MICNDSIPPLAIEFICTFLIDQHPWKLPSKYNDYKGTLNLNLSQCFCAKFSIFLYPSVTALQEEPKQNQPVQICLPHLLALYQINHHHPKSRATLKRSKTNQSGHVITNMPLYSTLIPFLHDLQHYFIPCVNSSRQTPMYTIILHPLFNPISKWKWVHIRPRVPIWPHQ